ncbi:MAG: hypothetical protein K2X93_08975, partial [Candidatus Obscuribacterales bacterium]|nr:hypothetical protein [Candidatus Obscuribacterales bacterium]
MPEEFHNQYEAPRKDIPWTPESFTQTPVNSRFETPTKNSTTDSSSSVLPPLQLEMSKAADIYESAWAIRQATGRGTAFVLGTDENKIYNVLQNLTETQRADLRQVYKMEYGISLEAELKREMSGRDLEKANNLLNRKDGTTDNAGFVRELVTELNHYVQGRSRDSIAEALRQKLVTMSSGDIDNMNQDYQKRYGKTAFDTVMSQSRLSPGNKEALKILFKGSDKTGDSDMAKLAKIAMGKGDLEMFAEAMSHTSPSGREAFAKKSGDLKSLNTAFNSSFMSMAEKAAKIFKGPAGELIDRSSGDQAVSHALDYMKYGKLSAQTQVIESSGWIDDNEKSIETALNTMSGEERHLYTTGSQLAERKGTKPTQQEQEAIDYYKGLRSAFARVGNKNEIAKWDDLARVKGGSHEKKTVADLLSENRGVLYNNRSAIVDGLLNLSDKEIDKYRSDKSFQKQVDSSVERALGGGNAYSKSAKHILDEIKTEGKAEDDIIVKMYRDGSNWDADDAGVVRSVEKAFKEIPDLHRKVASPRTQEEKAYSNKFKDALESALGGDYKTYGKKLIADGRLSIKDHTDLCQGYIYDDVASMAKSVATADGEEKKQLLSYDSKDRNAKELQNHVFSNFWGEQSDYLKTVLRAGNQAPEDTMRSFVVGAGATGKDVLDTYSQLDAKQQTKMNMEYAKKYQSSLISDLLDHLSTEESGMLPSVVKTEGGTLESMYNE